MLCLLCNLDKQFSFFVPLFSLPSLCLQEVRMLGSKICLFLCQALHCGALILRGMRDTLTPWDLLDSCPPSPAAVPGWNILQQTSCSCSGTSCSISSQAYPTHRKGSFHRLSSPVWLLPAVHSTQTGEQPRSNKQEYWPWAVVFYRERVCFVHDDFFEIWMRNWKTWQGAAQTVLEISWKHRLLFETFILCDLISVCWVHCGAGSLVAWVQGVKEKPEKLAVSLQKTFEFSLVSSLRYSHFNFSEKSSHPTLRLMMILLAEEDIFLPMQPAWNKGYKGGE